MDFIEQLSSSSGFTAILVVVDQLSKQSSSKHGVPAHVTSNQGTEFVSHFFWSLGKALNMRLHVTSGYHPEGDGQTECQTVKTGSPQVLLGGPGGQGTRVEVSPDTSRA